MMRNDTPRPTESEGDSNDASSSMRGMAAHIAASGPTPPAYPNQYGSVPNAQQFSFMDPNVMMMNSAAATIAAVAASAVHQMAQGKNGQSGVNGSTSLVPPALVAALQGARGNQLVPTHSAGNTAVHPHVAALFGSAACGQLQMQNSVVAAPVPSQFHHSLSSADSASTLHPSTAAAAHAAAGSMSNVLLPSMQTWNLVQLEQHLSLLQRLNQPVPQSVALLLSDSRRKEKKRTMKRVANRKSASTSRARKKALVDEMTKTNARLRRQAMILSLLPDLVVAITTEGEITFCSAQVERALQYKIDDLIGAKLQSVLVPASKVALNDLIEVLVNSEKIGTSSDSPPAEVRHGTKRCQSGQPKAGDAMEHKDIEDNGNSHVSGRGSSGSGERSGGDTSAAAIVSELSFPLSVVEVDSKQSARAPAQAKAEPNENSDTSASNSGGKPQMSSLTNSARLSRSPTASSEDDAARGGSQDSAKKSDKGKRLPSSDDSSSLSSDAKNMRTANENLVRNVRWHNQRMLGDSEKCKSDNGPTDDVTGASVTANNATARLSSLEHVPDFSQRKGAKTAQYESNGDQSSDDSLLAGVEEKKKGENASDDSGYRESNDSREETSSSGSDTSNLNEHRKKPLAPTCRICIIRQDLTTVWCEVTSSIRTRSSDEETSDSQEDPSDSSVSAAVVAAPPKIEVKELLLCLRPIRDGEKKVDETLRFVSPKSASGKGSLPSPGPGGGMVSFSSGDANNQDKDTTGSSEQTFTGGSGTNSTSAGTSSREMSRRPPKKRRHHSNGEILSTGEEAMQTKRKKVESEDQRECPDAFDTEKSVVESLMLMNQSQ